MFWKLRILAFGHLCFWSSTAMLETASSFYKMVILVNILGYTFISHNACSYSCMYLSEGFTALSLEVEHQHFINHSILLTFFYFSVLNNMPSPQSCRNGGYVQMKIRTDTRQRSCSDWLRYSALYIGRLTIASHWQSGIKPFLAFNHFIL